MPTRTPWEPNTPPVVPPAAPQPPDDSGDWTWDPARGDWAWTPNANATGRSGEINALNPLADPALSYVQRGNTGGYQDGVGITRGEGTSMTQAEYDRYVAENEAWAAGDPAKQAYLQNFAQSDPNDVHRAIAGYSNSPGGGEAGGAGDWWSQNAPNIGMSGGGFSSPGEYSALERPDYLQGPYVAPTWNETFQAPDQDAVLADPGYRTRLAAGVQARERAAAAQGSILSGGHQKQLERYGQEYGANEYAAAYGRAYDTYKQRYGQFQDQANMGLQARGVNENAFQNDVTNNLSQYNARRLAYQDQVGNNLSFARLGLDATLGGRP